jgi:1-acyl-sn-glycerol-3-phosphate acyltransferase
MVNFLRLLFWPMVRPRVEGQENFPEGPFVAVFNHSSNLDAMMMPSIVTRVACYWAKAEIKKWPLIGWLFSYVGAVYIRRGSGDLQAYQDAIARLEAGYVFFLAPEGTRHHNSDGSFRAKSGFIRLAQEVACPVVPMALSGSREAMPPGRFWPKRGVLRVRVGVPLVLKPIAVCPENAAALSKQAQDVMKHVYEMKAELDQRCS